MALEDLSLDEVLTKLEDSFDAAVAPEKIKRANDNKLHLMFKADAEGYRWLNKAALALRNRFDPELCDEADLSITGKIVGTEYRSGKISTLLVQCENTSDAAPHTLAAGAYQYESSSGEVFQFTVQIDTLVDPNTYVQFYAGSANIGAFRVLDVAEAAVERVDGSSIPSDFVFSCFDNVALLGYPEETDEEFRKRMISNEGRDDDITEIQNGILALPTILECNCVFNHLAEEKLYDGITLAPKELLVVISGVPTDEIADVVAKHSHYITHQVDPGLVVYHSNNLYVDGKYPVYYKFHDTVDFTLAIEYNFNSKLAKFEQVESAIDDAMRQFTMNNRHISVVTEKDFYDALSAIVIPGFQVLNVTPFVDAVEVSYISVPFTRVPRLVMPIGYTRHDTYEA